jgi:hypothetical protein
MAAMAQKNRDGLGFGIEAHTLDGPRPFQLKQLDEDVNVTHGRNSPHL